MIWMATLLGLCVAALLGSLLAWRRERMTSLAALADVARLSRLAERRADQVSALSHEIRTPLAMIKGAGELLRSETPGPLNHRQREFVATLTQQSDHVIEVAEGLLLQARIDAGLFNLHVAGTDVRPLVRSTVKAMGTLCDARAQRIELQCPPRLTRINVDQRLVRQALTNVLHNASRHTSEGGRIDLRVLDNDDELVFSVTDDGAGMTPEERLQLFGKFSSGRPLGDGTGLGLLITKQIVELHGGRVLVDTTLHRGTTFMLAFPHPPAVVPPEGSV
jgi:two-component system, OmpR family, sensor kinase